MASTPQPPQPAPDIKAFNDKLIAEFRANAGKLSGQLENARVMLLTTTGAKTFAPRTVVVGFRPWGERYAAIASNNGAPGSPHWFANLKANPVATVEIPGDTFQAKSRVADAAEKVELAKIIDYYERQQAITSREIPIVIFERI